MSILATRGDRTVLILRREGPQPKFDLAAIAKEIARGQANAEPPRVLFDWSGVTVWPFEAPAVTAIRYWYSLAPRITRAALIHDERWDRHASMLSALMRAVAAEVKSFLPGYQERAVAWLEAPLASGPGPKASRRSSVSH
jgi:SpoIIAA-like